MVAYLRVVLESDSIHITVPGKSLCNKVNSAGRVGSTHDGRRKRVAKLIFDSIPALIQVGRK